MFSNAESMCVNPHASVVRNAFHDIELSFREPLEPLSIPQFPRYDPSRKFFRPISSLFGFVDDRFDFHDDTPFIRYHIIVTR